MKEGRREYDGRRKAPYGKRRKEGRKERKYEEWNMPEGRKKGRMKARKDARKGRDIGKK